MPVVVQCPQCGQRMSVPDHAVGRVVRCPCGQVFQVPSPSGTAPQSPAAPAAPAAPNAPAGNVPPGWSAAYQQVLHQQAMQQQAMQQQAGRPPGAYPQQVAYPTPGVYPQPGAYPQQGGHPAAGYPQVAYPQAWTQQGAYPQPIAPHVPGQPGPGQPGPGVVEPAKPTAPKPKKGPSSRADLDAPLEMPADVGPSNLAPPNSPAGAESTPASDPNAPASLTSIPDTWEPHLIAGDDKPVAKPTAPGAGPGATPTSPGGGWPAGGEQPAPLGQWIANELTQPAAKPKASPWDSSSGGAVEEMPVIRGRMFGGRQRYRSASAGIKSSPGGLARTIIAVPLLLAGILYSVAGALATVGTAAILATGVVKFFTSSSSNDLTRIGIALIGLTVGLMLALSATFGGVMCITGSVGILRNERQGAVHAATGAGTLLALALLSIVIQLVMAENVKQLGAAEYVGPAFSLYLEVVLVFYTVVASFCLLVLLWCNTAGRRMPK